MSEYHNFGTPIPLHNKGLIFWGPFPKTLVRKIYLVVAIDHFTRWIEVKALASIAATKMKEFFYEDIICSFEIPKILISSNGRSLIPRNLGIL